jgi:Trypsin-like peptidase domain
MRAALRRIVVTIGLLILAATTTLSPGAWGTTAGRERTLAPTMIAPGDPAVMYLAKARKISIAQAQQRLMWQEYAGDLAAVLQSALGTRFGGLWIDPSDGDRMKVGVVGSPITVRRYAQRWGLENVTDVVVVRYPLAFLEAANSDIGNAIVRVNAGALWPLSAGIDTASNAVNVHLPNGKALTPAQKAVVEEAKRRYGGAVRVVLDAERYTAEACSAVWSNCDPPLRGGVQTASTYGGRCSVGFNVRSHSDGKPYVITAGHCRDNSGHANVETWRAFFTNLDAHVIGHWHRIIWDSTGDMGIIEVDNPSGWNPKPWVWVLPSTGTPPTTEDQSYYITKPSGSSKGMTVCMSGAYYSSGVAGQGEPVTACGTVLELDFEATYNGTTVKHLARTDADTFPGMSGGPVYKSHIAYGIIVAASSSETLYQGIMGAQTALNVDILTGAG